MAILRIFLIVVEVLVSVLLIGVVLLQKSREQGLGMAFGANVGESLFGSRAGNVLTKATILFGSLFAANTLFIGLLYAGKAAPVTESLGDRAAAAQTQPLTPPVLPANNGTIELPSPIVPPAESPVTPPAAPVAPDASAIPPAPVPDPAPAPEPVPPAPVPAQP